MNVHEFQYDLPPHLIAQIPSKDREHSRLMILERHSGRIAHRLFFELPGKVRPGDALVVNNTRVIKAKLVGQKETGGRVDLLLTKQIETVSSNHQVWECLVRTSAKLRAGSRIHFAADLWGQAVPGPQGSWTVRLHAQSDLRKTLERVGRMPLPPYIKRTGSEEHQTDNHRYQTIFARRKGSIAAPTAGLHFTEALLTEIRKIGAWIIPLTLHIGIGTFLPVRSVRVKDHRMHEEMFHISADSAEAINQVKGQGGRIIAVGTSTTRALESAAGVHGRVIPGSGATDLFIYPPFRFHVVDAMVTNFHLPGSTLMMLVCAFATRDLILKAYRAAIKREYRFYSYGDAMMIL